MNFRDKKRIIIELICDADKELPVSRDSELIIRDIEMELNCCWHSFEIQDIEIKDICALENSNG